jgi:hypothetical protein
MKPDNSMVSGFADLRRCILKWQVAIIEQKQKHNHETVRKLKQWLSRVEWCVQDFRTNRLFPDILRKTVNQEFDSDPLTTESVAQLIDYLSPANREKVEAMIEPLIAEQKQEFEDLKQKIKNNS